MKNILEKLENYLINKLNNRHTEMLQISEKDYDLLAFEDRSHGVFYINYYKEGKSVYISAIKEDMMDIINFREGNYNKEKLSKLIKAIGEKLEICGNYIIKYIIKTKGNDDFVIDVSK